MRRKGIVFTTLFLFLFVCIAIIIRHNPQEITIPVTTETVITKNLYHTINTAGTIVIKEVFKIGSLVAGTVKEVCVAENQHVKKGDLIAEIDIGKGDADYRYALHYYHKAIHEYEYASTLFKRQEALYKSGQLSRDNYERFKRDKNIAFECMKAYEALRDKTKRELDNAHIKAPADGTIIALNISRGAAVLNDFQNILCEIAHDASDLEARLDIDESDIGHIKKNQDVILSVNSFPHKLFRGAINSVSIMPKRQANGKEIKDEEQGFYKAQVTLEDKQHTLKPGMTTHARIAIDKRKKCKAINGIAFQISYEQLKSFAEQYGLACTPLDRQQKKTIRKNDSDSHQFIWIYNQQGFTERAITVGMTDNSYWEVKSGIEEHEKIVIDIDDRPGHASSSNWKLPL